MSDPNIITLTLNPSLDRTLITHYLGIGYHNHTSEATRLDPAGSGFTISRALHQLGVQTHAIVIIGKDATGHAYCALAEEEGFSFTAIEHEAQTRSSTIIFDTGSRLETQITDEGNPVEENTLQEVAEVIRSLVKPGNIVVLAGGLPENTPHDTYSRLIDVIHECDGLAAVSSCGRALVDTLPAGPDFITMTQVELEGHFNYPVREMDDIIECARKLQKEGAGRILIEMREKDHALLVSKEETLMVEMPLEDGGTTSGVWPALIAGYLAGRARHQPLEEALGIGAAAAGYAATQVGHQFGTLGDVKKFSDKTALSPAEPPEEEESPEEEPDNQ